MSTNPEPNPQNQQQLSPILKQKKSKRDTNRKKKHTSADLQQNTALMAKEKQLLLTGFCRKVVSNNSEVTNTNSTNSDYYLSSNINKATLEEQLQKKEQLIEKLHLENKNQQQKYAKVKQQFLEHCQKTKQSILESKKEFAAIKRKHMGQINSKFGHFRDQGSNFVEGEYLTSLKAKISNTEKLINEFEGKKSKSTYQQKLLLTSQIQYLKKQLKQLKEELVIREKQVDIYRQQLRLYYKSQDCIFAKESWPLLKNRYQPLFYIGYGGFGQVYHGFDIEKYQDVAIKINSLDKLSSQSYEQMVKHLNRQIKIHKQLQHPNIVKMIDQLQLDSNRIGIVMQYCTGPQLRAYLKKQGCLDQRQAKFIIKQLIYAIKYLHDQKYSVIHYDLKPANILFHHGTVKIVDFGISKIIQGEESRIDLTSPKIGTYYYLPPEVFDENEAKISSKVDIWSIGVIFFQLLYGKKPFGNGLSQQKILNSGQILKANKVDFPDSSPKKYKISEEAKQFIRKCLEYYPDKRLSSLQAYEDDYIN